MADSRNPKPEGLTFPSLPEAISYLRAIPLASARFHAQELIAREAFAKVTNYADAFEQYMLYVESDAAYKSVLNSEEFEQHFQDELSFARERRAQRNRRDEARRTIAGNWAHEPRAGAWVDALPPHLHGSKSFLDALRTFSRRFHAWDEAARRVNAAVQARLSYRARGNRLNTYVTTIDLVCATRGDCRRKPLDFTTPVPEKWLKKNGMRMGPFGIIESVAAGEASLSGSDGGAVNLTGVGDVSMGDNKFPGDGAVEGDDISRRGSRLSQNASIRGEGSDRASVGESDGHRELDAMSTSGETTSSSTKAESSDLWETASYQPESDISSDEDDDVRQALPGRKMCGCSLDVPDSWIEKLGNAKGVLIEEQLEHLEAMSKFRYVCYQHARKMGSMIGLKIHLLSRSETLSRLWKIRENKAMISKLKTDKDTYHWFRQESRPSHPHDQLGVYKYAPQPVAAFEFDPELVLRNVETLLGCSHLDIETTFETCGSVNVPVFTWWMEDEELCRMIDIEFNMYRYHLSDESRKSDPGWTYGQLHSLCQQLMRQDPVYWMLHCALRPDRHWRLVSCPQHTRYSIKGEDSSYKKLDIDLYRGVAWNIGVNMLVGSVSLDEENKDSSMVLRGMHHHYAAWWNDLRSRDLNDLAKFPYKMTDTHYTEDDQSKFGCEWIPAGCKKGEARLTMATVPYGDNPSTKPRRRTMAPQFIRLEDDMSTLEAPWFGEWRDLADSHIALTIPRNAFRRWKSKNYSDGPPSRFPAALPLDGLGNLSNALVCRAKWDDPLVIRERNLLLTGSIEDIVAYVTEWRENALARVKERFRMVLEEEADAFGKASYFFKRTESRFLR
ncbi:hypothetical protein F5B20DRAFT_586835 [Whalleya microplaca]|nr:hypothetical protein F5B20DRAFT_586835 [Whalleya microplaca]